LFPGISSFALTFTARDMTLPLMHYRGPVIYNTKTAAVNE